jgi:hypothetical protein
MANIVFGFRPEGGYFGLAVTEDINQVYEAINAAHGGYARLQQTYASGDDPAVYVNPATILWVEPN